MRIFLNVINELPNAEERLKGASRSTHGLAAALLPSVDQLPDIEVRPATLSPRFREGDENCQLVFPGSWYIM
jgi:hypothetical protein